MKTLTLPHAGDWRDSRGFKVALAIGLNILVLALCISCFELRFDENDDLTVQKFLDGQTAVKTPYCAYLNYFLAQALIWGYDLCHNSLPLFSLLQYAMLLISFTAVSIMLFTRLPLAPALAGSLGVLCFLGADAYLLLTYTKTAGISAAGGTALMLLALEDRPQGRGPMLLLGSALLLLSCMMRDVAFLACLGLMAPLGLSCLIRKIGPMDRGAIKRGAAFCLPFLLALAACALVYVGNELLWRQQPYHDYKLYNDARSAHGDYGIPDYDLMPEVYDRLGIDQNTLDMTGFYDTEKWSPQVYEELIEAKEELIGHPSIGECLGTFLDTCIGSFFIQRHIWGLLAALLLWAAWGRRDASGYLTLAGAFALFAAMYLLLIWRGRYLVNRTDVGFFFALTVTVLWGLEPRRAGKDWLLALALALVCLGLGWRQNRDYSYLYSENILGDDSAQKAAIERLIADREHIYLTGVNGVDHTLYSPLETVPAGYSDRIVLLGDWCVEHPNVAAILAGYDIVNPYRDMVDNDSAYLVVEDIEAQVAYIRKNYCPTARAELVEPLSTETGLSIYRILSH